MNHPLSHFHARQNNPRQLNPAVGDTWWEQGLPSANSYFTPPPFVSHDGKTLDPAWNGARTRYMQTLESGAFAYQVKFSALDQNGKWWICLYERGTPNPWVPLPQPHEFWFLAGCTEYSPGAGTPTGGQQVGDFQVDPKPWQPARDRRVRTRQRSDAERRYDALRRQASRTSRAVTRRSNPELIPDLFISPTVVPQAPIQYGQSQNPPQLDEGCCYDVASGRLRCGDEIGDAVSLLSMQQRPDGPVFAIVETGSGAESFPICDDPVTGCCYDPTTETLVCDQDDTLHGQEAGIVAAWVGQDGQIYVWAAWEGGGARMPMCPGTTECPPVFCCVNIQTMTYVCPGRPELNGQPADVVDIVTEGDYAWAVLPDDTKVPLCGQKCPAPRLTPESPDSTPGQWMSRQAWPERLEPSNPTDEPCCDACAIGHSCTGCSPIEQRQKNPCCDACAIGDPCTGCGDEGMPLPRRKIRFGNRG